MADVNEAALFVFEGAVTRYRDNNVFGTQRFSNRLCWKDTTLGLIEIGLGIAYNSFNYI